MDQEDALRALAKFDPDTYGEMLFECCGDSSYMRPENESDNCDMFSEYDTDPTEYLDPDDVMDAFIDIGYESFDDEVDH